MFASFNTVKTKSCTKDSHTNQFIHEQLSVTKKSIQVIASESESYVCYTFVTYFLPISEPPK